MGKGLGRLGLSRRLPRFSFSLTPQGFRGCFLGVQRSRTPPPPAAVTVLWWWWRVCRSTGLSGNVVFVFFALQISAGSLSRFSQATQADYTEGTLDPPVVIAVAVISFFFLRIVLVRKTKVFRKKGGVS